MIKAVIFDVDGLLADTEPLHFMAWKEVVEKYDVKLTKYVFIKRLAGIGGAETAIYFSRKYGLDHRILLKEKARIYTKLRKKVKPMAGAKAAVLKFRKIMPVSAASSSRTNDVSYVLKKIGVLKYLEHVTTADEVKRVKPFPDIYLLAAKKLRLEPKFCMVFEDTSVGVEAAKRAGMYCTAVPSGYTKLQDFSMADVILKSLKNISVEKILILGKTIR